MPLLPLRLRRWATLAGVALVTIGATALLANPRPPRPEPLPPPPAAPTAPVAPRSAPIFPVMLGIDVLEAQDFALLRGKRIGLLTHPAGVNRRGESTVEVLRRAGGVDLVALFGPEHGIYGDEAANVPVDDRIDPRTGLPVYSLYGKYRKPTPAMLRGLHTLVIDLQDVGARSYTYVSAMRYAMEAAFENGVEVMVLDRPNPLGGLLVDGPMLEEGVMSYVGAFRVPYVHGLTIGELAKLAKDTPGALAVAPGVQARGRLIVIPMRGWTRSTFWSETGLTWIKTSPFVPDLSAVLGYAMTGLGCQLGGFRHGLGQNYPFRALNFAGRRPEEVEAALRALNLPGFDFRIVTAEGRNGATERGVYVLVTDWGTVRPVALSIHLMRLAAVWRAPANPFAEATAAQAELFNKHTGDTALWEALKSDGPALNATAWAERHHQAARRWRDTIAQRYWMYPVE